MLGFIQTFLSPRTGFAYYGVVVCCCAVVHAFSRLEVNMLNVSSAGPLLQLDVCALISQKSELCGGWMTWQYLEDICTSHENHASDAGLRSWRVPQIHFDGGLSSSS